MIRKDILSRFCQVQAVADEDGGFCRHIGQVVKHGGALVGVNLDDHDGHLDNLDDHHYDYGNLDDDHDFHRDENGVYDDGDNGSGDTDTDDDEDQPSLRGRVPPLRI